MSFSSFVCLSVTFLGLITRRCFLLRLPLFVLFPTYASHYVLLIVKTWWRRETQPGRHHNREHTESIIEAFCIQSSGCSYDLAIFRNEIFPYCPFSIPSPMTLWYWYREGPLGPVILSDWCSIIVRLRTLHSKAFSPSYYNVAKYATLTNKILKKSQIPQRMMISKPSKL